MFLPVKTFTALLSGLLTVTALLVLWRPPLTWYELIAVSPSFVLGVNGLLGGTMLDRVVRRIFNRPDE